jgi:hypothetical protein
MNQKYPIGAQLFCLIDEDPFHGTEVMKASCEYEVVGFRPSIMSKGRWIYELQEIGVPRKWPFTPYQNEVESEKRFKLINESTCTQ